MGWFLKRGRDRAQGSKRAAPIDNPQTPSVAPLTKVDEAIAAAQDLPPGIDSLIQADFGYVSDRWGCEKILVLDKTAIRELLHKVVKNDLATGFSALQVDSHEGDGKEPPYIQLSSVGSQGFRPYRIVKGEDGQLALYGHAALYLAQRAMDRAKNPASASTADLIDELIAIGRVEKGLLPPRGSELRERIKSIGSALNRIGGKELMLRAHAIVRESLGAARARELEAAWDGVGDWLG